MVDGNFVTFSCQFLEKLVEKLLEKYEKYLMVSVSFENAVITLVHRDCAKYFPGSNQLMFQFV